MNRNFQIKQNIPLLLITFTASKTYKYDGSVKVRSFIYYSPRHLLFLANQISISVSDLRSAVLDDLTFKHHLRYLPFERYDRKRFCAVILDNASKRVHFHIG